MNVKRDHVTAPPPAHTYTQPTLAAVLVLLLATLDGAGGGGVGWGVVVRAAQLGAAGALENLGLVVETDGIDTGQLGGAWVDEWGSADKADAVVEHLKVVVAASFSALARLAALGRSVADAAAPHLDRQHMGARNVAFQLLLRLER